MFGGDMQDYIAESGMMRPQLEKEIAELKARLAKEWLPISEAPRDGTKFLGAYCWPILKEPALGVKYTYNYAEITFWRNNAWHTSSLNEPTIQECLYAWMPFNLPALPMDGISG